MLSAPTPIFNVHLGGKKLLFTFSGQLLLGRRYQGHRNRVHKGRGQSETSVLSL